MCRRVHVIPAPQGAAPAGGSPAHGSPGGRERGGAHVRCPRPGEVVHHEGPQQHHTVSTNASSGTEVALLRLSLDNVSAQCLHSRHFNGGLFITKVSREGI